MYVYLAEMRFSWRNDAVPPDEEGEIFHGRFERYTEKRNEAMKLLEEKSAEVRKKSRGEVLESRIYRVDVKVQPAKEMIINLLNKEGITGEAHLVWEQHKPGGRILVLGGSEGEE